MKAKPLNRIVIYRFAAYRIHLIIAQPSEGMLTV